MREADGGTQVVSERPVLQHERGDERERYAEQCHEQVTDGHVHDEKIGDRVHLRGECDHVADQPITNQGHYEHDRVHQIDDRLEHSGAQWDVVFVVTRQARSDVPRADDVATI